MGFFDYMATSIMGVIGDSTIAGLIVLTFFVGSAILQPSKLDAKLVIIVPAVILATALIPWWASVLAILGGLFFGRVILRIWSG
jgi:hypothetical protein